jgi:hypothetical protein
MDSSGPGEGPVAGSCEHGNEHKRQVSLLTCLAPFGLFKEIISVCHGYWERCEPQMLGERFHKDLALTSTLIRPDTWAKFHR